jgi:hypothetical protein
MNKKTQKIIMWSSATLIAVFIVLQLIKGKGNSDSKKDEGGQDNIGNEDGTWGDGCTNNRNQSEYGMKVMKLQKNLGFTNCDVDGFAGPITNAATKNKYPNLYIQYGSISVSNIDKYLTKLTTAQSPEEFRRKMVSGEIWR